MNKISYSNLTGKFLISLLPADNMLSGALIYICMHSNEGTMGFVINKQIKEFSYKDLALDVTADFDNSNNTVKLYNGGPMEKNRGFILHSDDYKIADSLNLGNGIMISSSIDLLKEISKGKGPKEKIIAMGYVGWAPNQLEQEIASNDWLVTDSSKELLFTEEDEQKLDIALASLGIENYNFSNTLGHS